MPIPASNIVQIEPRVIAAGREELEMNGLYVTDAPLPPVVYPAAVMEFTSANAVGEALGKTSEEYVFAQHYFNGYESKFASPKALFIARHAPEGLAAYTLGAANANTLAKLKAITAGTMALTIDGAPVSVSGIDLSGATSFADVAALASADASGWTLAYDGAAGRFILSTKTVGADGEAVAAGSNTDTEGNLAYALGLMPVQGALVSAGTAAETVAEVLDRVAETTQNWVTFTHREKASSTLGSAAETVGEQLAAWANAHWGTLAVVHDDTETLITAPSDADVIGAMSVNDNTAFIYGTTVYAAFIMGTVASIDWNRFNGTITLAFKRGDGLAATVNSEGYATVLEGRNANFYGAYATRNADFDFLYPGRLLNSDYVFIDPLVNAIWLNNALQVSILNGLTQSPRVPYTEAGFTRIRSWMMDPVNRALTNGAIEPGVTLSESQKSELAAEAGTDISEELYTQGYYIQILDPGASVRVNRETPSISLWYTYGGAVQRITVASTAVL